jgi:hypothetical protein
MAKGTIELSGVGPDKLTFDQVRLWATQVAQGQLRIWWDAGRRFILLASTPDGRCVISAYETEAEALDNKKEADKELGYGHSIIRPIVKQSAAAGSGK